MNIISVHLSDLLQLDRLSAARTRPTWTPTCVTATIGSNASREERPMQDTLARELADIATAAKDYAAHHQRIERIAYPPGVRLAVNFTADFDAMLLRRLMNEPPMQLAKGEFGGRVGIWRLI